METKPFIYFIFLLLFFKNFTYLFLERGEEKEKEKERNITVCLPLVCPLLGTWPSTQACALTGNGTSDPLVHRPTLNLLSHTSHALLTRFNSPFCYVPVPCTRSMSHCPL